MGSKILNKRDYLGSEALRYQMCPKTSSPKISIEQLVISGL